MSVKSFQLNTIAQRAGLGFVGLIYLLFLFFAFKWYIGNSITMQVTDKEVAKFAVGLAPDDPQTHYALAVLNNKIFLPEELQNSLAEYEKAAALAPNDYRFWVALGKARERSGDAAGAELALRKALELAPNYADLHWTFGNILLRQGKTQEAFAEIRRAAESNENYINPAVTTAWQIFGGDLAQIRQNIGASSQVNFALTAFLVRQNRFDEAFEIWNALPAEQKKTVFKSNGEEFYKEMLKAKKYRAALQIQNEIFDSEAGNFAVGRVSNGGFEAEVKPINAGIFEWQIADGSTPQIGFDEAQKHSGNRSLVIVFNSVESKDFRPISQIIAVEAGKKYTFEAFYKSALKASATLKWVIADVSEAKVLAMTDAIVNNSDWTNLKAEFTTSENTEAVILQLVRDNCQSLICPISGKVWFDDFSLNQ
ncbi:hypothetical protein BH24ACI2_BH24ACI2_02570 [soil metagenome]|jgi:tetratricopeptide (TPR) repeat protein|nr:carbohydrate binding domain-containing protein [Acidobacteriota bacterium]